MQAMVWIQNMNIGCTSWLHIDSLHISAGSWTSHESDDDSGSEHENETSYHSWRMWLFFIVVQSLGFTLGFASALAPDMVSLCRCVCAFLLIQARVLSACLSACTLSRMYPTLPSPHRPSQSLSRLCGYTGLSYGRAWRRLCTCRRFECSCDCQTIQQLASIFFHFSILRYCILVWSSKLWCDFGFKIWWCVVYTFSRTCMLARTHTHIMRTHARTDARVHSHRYQ